MRSQGKDQANTLNSYFNKMCGVWLVRNKIKNKLTWLIDYHESARLMKKTTVRYKMMIVIIMVIRRIPLMMKNKTMWIGEGQGIKRKDVDGVGH